MNMNSLVKSVEVWAMNKNLDKADPRAQYLKVVEEVGEIAAGLARNDKFEVIDAIGDSLVTLIILAKTIDSSAVECLGTAYDVIKDRTGKVVDGVFIKDGE
ncbi:hypothetical protein HMPREF9257_0553 [Eremococcus coleocola ACS-139-V-Col8]|uniref:NTP pyrophosphohydrolase MazG putative catalytic core domain-containing protein n=2 Tax=Eremococcus TaxID=171412 RepID=E4KQJ5_9LACT|nr:hypothetical protein HMPREF9257_0553 [Eremococcus coleocola ACS-139-V-Col8]